MNNCLAFSPLRSVGRWVCCVASPPAILTRAPTGTYRHESGSRSRDGAGAAARRPLSCARSIYSRLRCPFSAPSSVPLLLRQQVLCESLGSFPTPCCLRRTTPSPVARTGSLPRRRTLLLDGYSSTCNALNLVALFDRSQLTTTHSHPSLMRGVTHGWWVLPHCASIRAPIHLLPPPLPHRSAIQCPPLLPPPPFTSVCVRSGQQDPKNTPQESRQTGRGCTRPDTGL